MLQLGPGLVRIPDVSFISWEPLPDRSLSDAAICRVAPDLAIELVSEGNTREELDRKLNDLTSCIATQLFLCGGQGFDVLITFVD